MVTLAIAAAGGCRWVWTRRSSGPRLLVGGRAVWIPDQFRVPRQPGTQDEELVAYEVVVRNGGEGDAVIEGWGMAGRNGAVLYPPPRDWEGASLQVRLSCPVPCRSKAHDHAHRWYLPASYLEEWCDDEHVRLEDVRPWVRRASDGKVIWARRWGLLDFEADDFGRRGRLAGMWGSASRCATRSPECA